MKRLDEAALGAWARSPTRKPLVVRGARQVGKSTLVRRVARAADLPLWEVNLEHHAALDPIFAGLDPASILREIGLRLGLAGVGHGRGLLFLDEIQAAPHALPALRYLAEARPDLPIAAAGSLLEFTLAEGGFAMPVGRIDYHFLGPMTFAEFLEALGESQLLGELHAWTPPAPFSPAAHERLLGVLREYLVVGGMPEAVARYAEARDLVAATRVHRSILGTYVDDFSKYARGSDLERLRRIFEALPGNLGRKVRYNRFHPDWRAADVRRALELLLRAGVATAAVHSDGRGVPLGASEDPSVYKLFHLDVGLVSTATGLGQTPAADIVSGRFINEGVLAEQFVAQHLLRRAPPGERPRLYYWQRGGASRNAEVDFLVQRGREILPIEVKAGSSGALRSLHQFMLARPGRSALRLDTNAPSVQAVDVAVMAGKVRARAQYRLTNLPLYLVERAVELVAA